MNKIAEIFTSLDYSPASEAPETAFAWLTGYYAANYRMAMV